MQTVCLLYQNNNFDLEGLKLMLYLMAYVSRTLIIFFKQWNESILTKQIYIGCLKQMNSKCKTWFHRVSTFLVCHDMEQVSRERHVNTGNVMRAIETKLSAHYESQWKV